ncbi:ABC transporter permease [Algoriphagus antarcticus]|uniref:Putative ABC transport system permease protein n=1 Tax=Algoriphagus antarcticus TaxID=238540 RepID=A0A3E0DIT2_9BACT|nr:ABC transporter permease [Algoriphagus antarcticus]REG82546.1 putative ABC transport system permease protein [Algoriphagus antarcticus]
MFKNYLKIAFRGYLRNRKFTALNLMSLVAGLFVAYVGISYISFENSYESFHENSDQIYRLARTYRSQDYSVIGFSNWSDDTAESQQGQAETFKSSPGIENITQFITSPNTEFIRSGESKIQNDGILTTNTPAGFVNMFTWEPILGTLESFSSGNKKVMLTASVAEKLFGPDYSSQSGLINSSVQIGGEDYELAAIIQDVPLNSHFDFQVAISSGRIDYWGSRIYVQTSEKSDFKEVESQLNKTIAGFNPRLAKEELYAGHYLQPIQDIHLNSNILYESKTPGNTNYITLIGFFAGFILVITIFNYANLTLAIKSKESKTIGVRKAMGAQNSMITTQFLMEGVLLSLIALPFVGLLISLVIPQFNALMGTAISNNLITEPMTFLTLLVLAILVGILASLSPAIYLSMRGAVSLFKEDLKQSSFQQFPIRKYLVISQFVLLIAISCVSYFISQQLLFVEGKDIGYKKKGILYTYSSPENRGVFQQRLRQISGVIAVGNGSSFGIQSFNQGTYQLEGLETVFDDSNQLYLDFEGIKAYELETTLKEKPGARTTLINRTAAEKYANLKGITAEDLIGMQIVTEPEYTDEESGQIGFPFTIGGIFEDINLFSLHEKVEPYFLTIYENVEMDGRSIVSYYPENAAAVLAAVNSIYSDLDEPFPLELEFLSENVSQLYAQDRQTADLLLYFNIIAVFLAALGIIGITIFLTMARKKEIGIRKVLGASVFSIIQSATKEYLILVGIAFLIAWPIAYYAANSWLSNFAYRIEINQFVFASIGLMTFAFTAVIVGIIAYQAAQANPVNSLKSE